MSASGSSIFTDAEGYQSGLLDLLDLVVPEPRAFQARLTWLDLSILHILRGQESAARLGILRAPADEVFVVFPTRQGSTLVVDGVELPFGEAIVHSLNEISHHRTIGACEWGSVSLTPASLLTYGRIIAGCELVPPTSGQALHLPIKPRQRLMRLHRQAARLVETHLARVIHPEVARALEQDLLCAVIGAVAGGKPAPVQPCGRRAAALVQRYEEIVGAHPDRLLRVKDICASLDVSERVLRVSCTEVLGMSPDRYQRLRRLKRVRAELRHGGTSSEAMSQVLARYGFGSIHRFVAEYWGAYGEMPPLPPRARG